MKKMLCLVVAVSALAASGQTPPNPRELLDAQREAVKVFSHMDGVWRGVAETVRPSGEKHKITQTERVGPFLDGTVKVIEGRGYESDGRVSFNALGIISYDPATKSYSMRSYAMGRKGDFPMRPTADGFVWEIPAGPATIRYTATIRDGKWREIGERIMEGKDPVRFFEMNLSRISDSEWPAAGSVPPK